MTTISSSNAAPIAYTHPYLVCHDASSSTLSVWTCTGESSQLPQLQATLEGLVSRTARPHVFALDRLVTHSVNDTESTVLVHSLPDGRLLDQQVLIPRGSNDTLYISESGFIAVRGDADKAQVYKLSDGGKLSALGDLSNHVKEDLGSVVQDTPRSSDLPNGVYLTADCFIQAYVRYPSPIVHITLQSTGTGSSANRRHAEFGLTRTIPSDLPDATMHSMLIDSVPIQSSSAFVMAHVEQVLGFNEEHPKTALRSVDSETLARNWCTLIDQRTKWLRYSQATGFLVAYGCTGIEGDGIVVLDAMTGSVLREEPIGKPAQKCGALGAGVHCDLTPGGDELVVVFGDGQLAVVSLASFVMSGFPRESGESDSVLVTIPCPEFTMSTPVNAKEKRSKANGAWSWIKRAFVVDGNMVVVVPEKGSDFAVLKWR